MRVVTSTSHGERVFKILVRPGATGSKALPALFTCSTGDASADELLSPRLALTKRYQILKARQSIILSMVLSLTVCH